MTDNISCSGANKTRRVPPLSPLFITGITETAAANVMHFAPVESSVCSLERVLGTAAKWRN